MSDYEEEDYFDPEPMSDFEHAMICLYLLWEGDETSDLTIIRLLDLLEKMGLALFDIGSSDVEMETAFYRGTRMAARTWLKRVRNAGNDLKRYELRRYCFYQEVENGAIDLSELGTSEEEIESLRPKSKEQEQVAP
jgi:hypothetical protein